MSLTVLLASLLLPLAVFGCDLEVSQSPVLRGIRLGNNVADIAKIYPSLKTTSPLTIWARSDFRSDLAFENISKFLITFDKSDQVDSVSVSYISLDSVDTLNSFAESVARNLGLPKGPEYWEPTRNRAFAATMKCKGFTVTIDEDLKSIVMETASIPPSTKPFKP